MKKTFDLPYAYFCKLFCEKKVNRLQKDFSKFTYNIYEVCLILELAFQKAISY